MTRRFDALAARGKTLVVLGTSAACLALAWLVAVRSADTLPFLIWFPGPARRRAAGAGVRPARVMHSFAVIAAAGIAAFVLEYALVAAVLPRAGWKHVFDSVWLITAAVVAIVAFGVSVLDRSVAVPSGAAVSAGFGALEASFRASAAFDQEGWMTTFALVAAAPTAVYPLLLVMLAAPPRTPAVAEVSPVAASPG